MYFFYKLVFIVYQIINIEDEKNRNLRNGLSNLWYQPRRNQISVKSKKLLQKIILLFKMFQLPIYIIILNKYY